MNTVNFIRSRLLNHRWFRELLIDTEAAYGDVIYHSFLKIIFLSYTDMPYV
jgi:hypothetical protein